MLVVFETSGYTTNKIWGSSDAPYSWAGPGCFIQNSDYCEGDVACNQKNMCGYASGGTFTPTHTLGFATVKDGDTVKFSSPKASNRYTNP